MATVARRRARRASNSAIRGLAIALVLMVAQVGSLGCDPVREARVTNDTDQQLFVVFQGQPYTLTGKGWVSEPTRLEPGKTVGWGLDSPELEVSVRLSQLDGQVVGCLRFALKGLDENATVTQKASAAAQCQW